MNRPLIETRSARARLKVRWCASAATTKGERERERVIIIAHSAPTTYLTVSAWPIDYRAAARGCTRLPAATYRNYVTNIIAIDRARCV